MEHRTVLLEGAILTVDEHRSRVRVLPLESSPALIFRSSAPTPRIRVRQQGVSTRVHDSEHVARIYVPSVPHHVLSDLERLVVATSFFVYAQNQVFDLGCTQPSVLFPQVLWRTSCVRAAINS